MLFDNVCRWLLRVQPKELHRSIPTGGDGTAQHLTLQQTVLVRNCIDSGGQDKVTNCNNITIPANTVIVGGSGNTTLGVDVTFPVTAITQETH